MGMAGRVPDRGRRPQTAKAPSDELGSHGELRDAGAGAGSDPRSGAPVAEPTRRGGAAPLRGPADTRGRTDPRDRPGDGPRPPEPSASSLASLVGGNRWMICVTGSTSWTKWRFPTGSRPSLHCRIV